MPDVLEELECAQAVFVEKTSEQARHMAWVIAVIYAKVGFRIGTCNRLVMYYWYVTCVRLSGFHDL